MTLNFPNAPTNGQVFEGYQYSTEKGVWARTNFSAVAASTTNAGIVQLATAAETLAGIDTVRAVTPVGLEPLRSRLTATVEDFTALTALSTANSLTGDLAFVVEGEVYMFWDITSQWRQLTTARFLSTAARDTAYAKSSAVYLRRNVRAVDMSSGIESHRGVSSWVLDDTGWLAAALGTGWSGASGETPQYRRLDQVVYLAGRMTTTAANIMAFQLPVGFRPSVTIVALAEQGGNTNRMVIGTSGSVSQVVAASVSGISLGSLPPFVVGG